MITKYRLEKRLSTSFCILLVSFCVVVFIIPFYFLVINSFKDLAGISKDVAKLPETWLFSNFGKAWTRMDFPRALKNSLIVTVTSLTGVIIFSSMAAYRITRYPSKWNNFVYVLCLAEMIIPFQVIMIPLVVVLKNLGLINSLAGLVFSNWGLGVALGVFMFSGFIKSVPRELEESAMLEGCSEITLFFRIVFPLLKPIVFTLIILDTFWFWNDYLLPVLVISKPAFRTLPIAISSFMGQYFLQWDLALPALTMAILPAAAAFLLLQKHIVAGLVAGAVKG
ncbi:MAG: carbohydrate ABC transporter permease [Sphaerochaetaceae bacterium]|nr:carbohydrate ABC transporter permease [Sphaerochaetaceae bacterium]